MCGILGVAFEPLPDDVAFARGLAHLRRRGPDDLGVYRDDHVLLGHTRLSVLDLSQQGHQPMRSAAGRHAIVFNGEIYNFAELRRRHLPDAALRSNSDTEVLLELFARLGPACVGELRGMFAFAIYDRVERSLFLARDRLGLKPLYLAPSARGLRFASEVGALSALSPGRLSPSLAALSGFLAAGHVPASQVALSGVVSLPPGSWALAQEGRLTLQRYWTFPSGPARYRSRGEAVEALRPVLAEAVRLRCVADVPLGAFLSGGIDSSAVVTLMRAAGQRQLRTFSLAFPGSSLDEARFAEQVARQLGTDHTSVAVSEGDAMADLEAFFDAMDQPTLDGFNTFLVSKHAKASGLTVALSGLGGDELFGGYPSFRRASRFGRPLALVPRPLFALAGGGLSRVAPRFGKLDALAGRGSAHARLYAASRGLFDARERRALLPGALPPPWLEPEAPGDAFHDTMQLELRGYTQAQLLRDADVFGMCHALEIRVPLLDHVLVETAARVSSAVVLAGPPKALLLDALPSALPAAIRERPKMGFTLPFARWLRGGLRERVLDTLQGPTLGGLGLDSRAVRRVYEGFERGRVHWSRPWALYALARWAERLK